MTEQSIRTSSEGAGVQPPARAQSTSGTPEAKCVLKGGLSAMSFGLSVAAAITLPSPNQAQILQGLLFRHDSVIANFSAAHETFGEERLLGLKPKTQGRLPEATLAGHFEDVARFAGSAPQSDDITLAALYWKGNLP